MEHQSKEVFGGLLEDSDFWKRPADERVEIIDYAADQFVRDDMPQDELLKWSENRGISRLAARLGPEGYANLSAKLARRGEDGPLPEELQDKGAYADFSSGFAFPYGQTIVLDPLGKDEVISAPSTAVPVEIPAGGDKSIKLTFLPIGSKVGLDIETPKGTKRHKFDSLDQVPKSGLEMARFLESNYAEDFGVNGGLISELVAQNVATAKSFARGAVQAVSNVPSMLETTIAEVMYGEYGKEFSKNYTIDANGAAIPMPKDLSDRLWDRAKEIQRQAGSVRRGYGTMGGSTQPYDQWNVSLSDAFVSAHQEHLDSMDPFEVTGRFENELPSTALDSIDRDMARVTGESPNLGKFIADAPFAVMDQADRAANPDAENIQSRGFHLKPGDKLTAKELFAAHVALQDAPKAKELTNIYRKHLENVRAIDEVYGMGVEQTLRNSRAGIRQMAMNVAQDAAGVTGQMLPMLPAAIAVGPAAGVVGTAAIAAPGIVTGYAGNMAETLGTVYQDNLQAGKSEQDAILNAVDAGIASAVASAPVDALGEVAIGKMFSNFGDAFRSLGPMSRKQLAKRISQVIDPALAGKSMTREFIESSALQMVSEATGELTRSSVADQYREDPDGFAENFKNSLYEGALALVAAGGMSAGNAVANSITSVATKGLVDNRLNAAKLDAVNLTEIMKLPPAERDSRLKEWMLAAEEEAESGLPSTGSPTKETSAQQTTLPENAAPRQSRADVAEQMSDAEWETQRGQQEDAYQNAPITTDPVEMERLDAYSLKPGDIISEVSGVPGPMRILGAIESGDGTHSLIRGILPNGQEISIPEMSLESGFSFVSSEESQQKTIQDRAQEAPAIAEIPDAPAVEPADPQEQPAPPPIASPVSPETIDFQKSTGITPANFATDGSIALPSAPRSIEIVASPPEAETTPAQAIERNYESSVQSTVQILEASGATPVSHQPLGSFIASEGITLDAFLADEEIGSFLSDLPVFVATMEGVGQIASNIRVDEGGLTKDAVVLNKDEWEAASMDKKSSILAHEVLHSSIGDWQRMATSPVATEAMKATWSEVEGIGKSIFTAASNAATPSAQAFRAAFSSIFNSKDYSPSKPHLLVEELMVRGLTDSRSRALLQMVDADLNPLEKGDAPKPSLWDRIVFLFRKMAGWDGARPQAESLMDSLMRLHKDMSAQVESFALDSYSSPDKAEAKAQEMGLPKDGYSIDESNRIVIEQQGMAQIREPQATLDAIWQDATFIRRLSPQTPEIASSMADLEAAFAGDWREEDGETNREKLDARTKRITEAQNRLVDLSEAHFGSLRTPDAINAQLSPSEQAAMVEHVLDKAAAKREKAMSNRFILDSSNPESISSTLTNEGKNQEAYNRYLAERGVALWAAGIRSFPAWQKAMWKTAPEANLTALWNNIEQSIVQSVRSIGANGYNAFQAKKAASISRKKEYDAALVANTPGSLQTFYSEALQFAKTKLTGSTRTSLFTYGPLGQARNRFIRVEKSQSGFSSLIFDQEAFQREYDAAMANPEENIERLKELDDVPNVVRQTKERIDGTREAKRRIAAIFTDSLSRVGIDRTGAAIIWNQIRMTGDTQAAEARQSINAAIDRVADQYGIRINRDFAQKRIQRAARQAYRAFRKAHNLSPEKILDQEKTSDIAKAARKQAAFLGRHHGRNLARAFADGTFELFGQIETADGALAVDVFEDGADQKLVIEAYNKLYLGKKFDLENQPGFDSATLEALLGRSLDFTYLRSFVDGTRSELLRRQIDWANNEGVPLYEITNAWLGEPVPADQNLWIGGVNLKGKTLFSGFIDPLFRALDDSHGMVSLRESIVAGTDQAERASRAKGAERLGELRKAYDSLIKGDEGRDVEAVREQIANNLLLEDPEFRKSFSKSLFDKFSMSEGPVGLPANAGPVALVSPGEHYSLLRRIQDARGGLKTNLVDSSFAEFADSRFDAPQESRQDRANIFNQSRLKDERQLDWSLQVLQTRALFLLSEGDASRAMQLARMIVADSVDSRGYPRAEYVSSKIEELLTAEAANERNLQLLSQRSLDQFLPRIQEALPLDSQKVAIALLDSRAEVVSLPSIVEQFALMDDSSMGRALGSFLGGQIRDIPVLLLDTSLMSPESMQAFKESELLSNRTAKSLEALEGQEGLLVVDVGPGAQLRGQRETSYGNRAVAAIDPNQTIRRILAEAVRDRLKSGDLKNVGPHMDALSEATVLLDHAVNQLSNLPDRDQSQESILETLQGIQQLYGGFEQMGASGLIIETLSNPDFRQALSHVRGQFSIAPTVIQPQISALAREIGAADYNEGARKFFDIGRSYEDLQEQAEPSDDFDSAGDEAFNIAEAFSDLAQDSIFPDDTMSFSESILANAMQTLWSSGNYLDSASPIDFHSRYQDTIPDSNKPSYEFANAIAEARTLNQDGTLNKDGGEAFTEQVRVMGSVIRSVRSRAGNSYQAWVKETNESEVAPGAEAEALPGATTREVSKAYEIKSLANPANPLAAGNYDTVIPDPQTRRLLAKDFAQDYWDNIFLSAEYAELYKKLSDGVYSWQWARDNPLKQMEDLAEFLMKPNVGRSVKATVQASIIKTFVPDVGERPDSARKLKWNFLHDEWAKRVGIDMAASFITGSVWNPVGFDDGFNSLKRFAHNDAVYRIYGAGSPQTLDNIMGVMQVMDSGVSNNRGHNGFRSKMIDLEARWREICAPMGRYRRDFVRATLVGNLTQFAVDGDPMDSVRKMVTDLERGYANLLANGKNSRGVYKLRKIFRQEMDRFLPLAVEFASGNRGKDEYVAEMRSLLSPAQLNWLDESRKMFAEVQQAMEIASVNLGRDMGAYENYTPLLNGRIMNEGLQIDNMWREPGQKVGTSRAKSMNKRFAEKDADADYILDLDGSKFINKLRRDIYTLETVTSGLLLHEVLGTKGADGNEYRGRIMSLAEGKLSEPEKARLRTTVLGLRGVYDRTRTGFQSGMNIDNRVRRFLVTAQQIGAYKSLADPEQIPLQTLPGLLTYTGRLLLNSARGFFTGDQNHIRAFSSVISTMVPGKADLRKNMTELMKNHAPSVFLRGFDGNAAFNERLALELKDRLKGFADFRGIADHVFSYAVGAARAGARLGLDWTVGKWDAILTSRIFFTEYARLGYAGGYESMDAIFNPSNWNPKWAREAKAKSEELMGSSALEERGTVMQMKGATVGKEFLSTALRAYGIHNISMSAHARALGNEFEYGTASQKVVAASKILEIGLQQALFNALKKPLRDWMLATMISAVTGKDRDDVYFYLLNKWPLDRRTKPIESGYDLLQTRGWKTLFDSTPMLGAYGAALSLPVVNDVIKEALTEGYGDHGIKSYTAKALGKPKYRPYHKGLAEHFVGSTGYLGVTAESLIEGYDAGMKSGEWGKVLISQIAPRGIAARLNQEMKMKSENKKESTMRE